MYAYISDISWNKKHTHDCVMLSTYDIHIYVYTNTCLCESSVLVRTQTHLSFCLFQSFSDEINRCLFHFQYTIILNIKQFWLFFRPLFLFIFSMVLLDIKVLFFFFLCERVYSFLHDFPLKVIIQWPSPFSHTHAWIHNIQPNMLIKFSTQLNYTHSQCTKKQKLLLYSLLVFSLPLLFAHDKFNIDNSVTSKVSICQT